VYSGISRAISSAIGIAWPGWAASKIVFGEGNGHGAQQHVVVGALAAHGFDDGQKPVDRTHHLLVLPLGEYLIDIDDRHQKDLPS
jgi:hypothetical protein